VCESEYEKFAHKIRTAPDEQTVLVQTSQLLKEYGTDHSRYSKVYNYPFIAFPKNVGFNTGLSAAQPDMVEGLEIPEFEIFPVRQQLGGAAVPTSSTNAITLQHFAILPKCSKSSTSLGPKGYQSRSKLMLRSGPSEISLSDFVGAVIDCDAPAVGALVADFERLGTLFVMS
jgi:hypothetical protein